MSENQATGMLRPEKQAWVSSRNARSPRHFLNREQATDAGPEVAGTRDSVTTGPFVKAPEPGEALPIAAHGLIGDGRTAALVGRDGRLVWLCVPTFDAPPLFCELLDCRRGGAFAVTLEDLQASRHYYEPNSAVLVTELRGRHGTVQLTDALLLEPGADLKGKTRSARGELCRSARVSSGRVRLRIYIAPYGGAKTEPRGGGLRIRSLMYPDLDLQLWSSAGASALSSLDTVVELEEGERLNLILGWDGAGYHHRPASADELVEATRECWRRWSSCLHYEGPEQALVQRSAITLKLLDHFENGAMVAAPTSSLPEIIGGVRNWDYRFTWIRDAAFSVYALRRIGLVEEASAFLGWVLGTLEAHGRPRVLYTLGGGEAPREREDALLAGYRASAPVRWGNAAAGQRQHDVFGEILDCAYQWSRHAGAIDRELWNKLGWLAELAQSEWHKPDQGIWEVRVAGRPFTYSAALCQVALDRVARLAEAHGLPGDVAGWKRGADKIRRAILEQAWNSDLQALTEQLGGGGLDAAVLALPLRRVLDARHPRMVATTRAVADTLGAGRSLLYRYDPAQSPDGVPGGEGAFLICSFWLVDNLALQGRFDEARDLFSDLCSRANPLGLLPEQIDPDSGEFLGNYPQAFSHVGLISSAVTLSRLERGEPLHQLEHRAI
jgi:alpha,alpha-trehalase